MIVERNGPRVCIGMVLYNDEEYINETIDSLLAQTYNDFTIVICDDCSTDRTGEIARQSVGGDSRITYYRNRKRMGLAANSRIAFDRCRPSDYFAWASGHDVYHPKWIEKMVGVLETYSNVILAYPLTKRISESGENLDIKPTVFDTMGMNVKDRIRESCFNARGFGNMIYGLFRSEALQKAGIFPNHLMPDSLLITKLSLQGSVKQVEEELWLRRFPPKWESNIDFLERQKKTVFARAPFYTEFPWAFTHFLSIAWNGALKPFAGSLLLRYHGLLLAWFFLLRRWKDMIPRIRYKLSNIEWLRKSYRYLIPRK